MSHLNSIGGNTMKSIKRSLAFLLALVLLFSETVTAFADDVTDNEPAPVLLSQDVTSNDDVLPDHRIMMYPWTILIPKNPNRQIRLKIWGKRFIRNRKILLLSLSG